MSASAIKLQSKSTSVLCKDQGKVSSLVEQQENEALEINLLLEAIFLKYGYDFRHYARASIDRRLARRLQDSGLDNYSQMTHKLLHDRDFFEVLILDLSINVTEMFRDPEFYLVLRKEIVPLLQTWPSLKIWIAGCSTGEEVYSMAIVLKEAGLAKRSLLYGTDFNESVLYKAKKGIYTAVQIQKYTANYLKSGGCEPFSNYYNAHYDAALMAESLRHNILFAAHNLATDRSFNEMQLISCRNVLIYFDNELQNQVLKMFYDSLVHGGFLALGTRESLINSEYANKFEEVDSKNKIYRKKR